MPIPTRTPASDFGAETKAKVPITAAIKRIFFQFINHHLSEKDVIKTG
jgi:hypothetical protein